MRALLIVAIALAAGGLIWLAAPAVAEALRQIRGWRRGRPR